MNDINNSFGGFKKFVKSSTRIIDKISVTTNGGLGFSTSFSNDHKLSEYTGVVLYWNSETQEIGIEFTTATGDDVLKLNRNINGYGYTVSAKAFFDVNHIDKDSHRGRFGYRTVLTRELGLDSDGSLYIFKLSTKTNSEQGGE